MEFEGVKKKKMCMQKGFQWYKIDIFLPRAIQINT